VTRIVYEVRVTIGASHRDAACEQPELNSGAEGSPVVEVLKIRIPMQALAIILNNGSIKSRGHQSAGGAEIPADF